MPKTLLLADDSVTIQKVVGISFANEDIRLVTVDNGDDALARARELVPDIVLADVVMPGMNGYEVCEAIKSDASLRHVPVLLLTGTFEAFDEQRARRVGADGHVTKPFEAQALVDRVHARLAEAARPDAASEQAPGGAASGHVGAASELEWEAETPASVLEDEITVPDDAPDIGHPGTAQASWDRETQTAEGATAFELEGEDEEAFAFEAPAEEADEAALGPLGESSRDEFADGSSTFDATVALDDDALANAETLPPVDPDPEEPQAAEPSDPTRIAWEEAPGWDSAQPEPGAAPEPHETTPSAQSVTWLDEPEPPAAPGVESGGAFGALDADAFASAQLDAPEAARAYDVSSSDLGELVEAGPAAAPPEAEPAGAAPTAPALAGSPTGGAREPALGSTQGEGRDLELSPAFRRQIQDALEKVAWEAFGDLAEKLVKDTLDRVERVAWEVVPQMAETLIQEEIRRLKGEEDPDTQG